MLFVPHSWALGAPPTLLFGGDSTTAGNNMTVPASPDYAPTLIWPAVLMANASLATSRGVECAHNGWTSADLISNYTASVAVTIVTSGRYIHSSYDIPSAGIIPPRGYTNAATQGRSHYHLHIGSNDIGAGGLATDVLANINTLLDLSSGNGCTTSVGVPWDFVAGSVSPEKVAQMTALQTGILAISSVRFVLDVRTALGTPGQTPNFFLNDGHCAAPGQAIYAQAIFNALTAANII